MITKAELKDFCEKLGTHLLNDDHASFSTWGSSFDNHIETVQHLYSESPQFIYEEETYIIQRESARNGKGGQDEGSPETWTVRRVIPTAAFNADDFLNKKTFRIADWRTGPERIKKLGYDPELDYDFDCLWATSHEIFEKGFNTMQLKLSSGDIILWINTGKFTQS